MQLKQKKYGESDLSSIIDLHSPHHTVDTFLPTPDSTGLPYLLGWLLTLPQINETGHTMVATFINGTRLLLCYAGALQGMRLSHRIVCIMLASLFSCPTPENWPWCATCQAERNEGLNSLQCWELVRGGLTLTLLTWSTSYGITTSGDCQSCHIMPLLVPIYNSRFKCS